MQIEIDYIEKQMQEISKITKQIEPMTNLLEFTRLTLKTILNNDFEYDRLINVLVATHNVYDVNTEIFYLQALIKIAKRGIDTKWIDSAYTLSNCYAALLL